MKITKALAHHFFGFSLTVFAVLFGFWLNAKPVAAYVPVACNEGDCGGKCESWEKCVKGSSGNYCSEDASCGPTPKKEQNPPTPTPPPNPPSGGGGEAPPAATNTPTPTLGACDLDSSGNPLDCSGLVCGDDTNAPCTGDGNCAGDYTCNTATGFCQKCTQPGTKCCGFCNPAGWGCDGNTCPFEKNYKKVACKSVDANGVGTCYSCDSINGGPDCQWAGEGSISCSSSVGGNSCGDKTCPVYYSDCYEACEPTPTPTPVPVCSINSLTASPVAACFVSGPSDTVYNLSWSVANPDKADYLKIYYDQGNGWEFIESVPSNTTSETFTMPFKDTGYNFNVSCYSTDKGNHNGQTAGTAPDYIYQDQGAPNDPSVYTPDYDAANNKVTFRWAWTGDQANCASGACDDHEGPVGYCWNDHPNPDRRPAIVL